MTRCFALPLAFALFAGAVRAEPIVVTVDPNNAGAEISPDFLGLSYEMSTLLPGADGKYFFRPDNRELIRLFRTLGVKSLRLGGNTADRPSVKVPGKAEIDSLFGFAAAAGVKVLYTLRLNEGETKPAATGPAKAGSKETLKPYDPQADAEIANYILAHYSANLACFIIGNEPDHYYADFPSYREAWERFAGAITAPEAKFCGPSTTPGRVAWAGDFARELGAGHRVAFISQHEYAAGSGRTANVAAAREKLLSSKIEQAYQKLYDAFVPAVLGAGQHYRLEECNSLSNGGTKGVSDAFAAALWGVDYMYWWAAHGADGVNFHTGGPGSGMKYSVFVNSSGGNVVHPLGYAMKMFDLGARGRLLPARVNSPDQNLRAYAVLAADGAVYVTIVNKNYAPDASAVEVDLYAGDEGWKAGPQVIFLLAPGHDVNATSGLTLGGASIKDDGTWQGTWSPLPASKKVHHFLLQLPPAAIAVAKITR